MGFQGFHATSYNPFSRGGVIYTSCTGVTRMVGNARIAYPMS